MGRRVPRWMLWTGIPVVAVIAIVALWDWDWFIPMVESRASATLQRPVKITHLHVHLGRVVQVTADGVEVANPSDWKQTDAPPFVQIDALKLGVDVWEYVRNGALVIPFIALDHPRVALLQQPDGAANYNLQMGGSSGGDTTKIGDLRISNGEVMAKLAKLRTDMNVVVNTQGEGQDARILAEAKGTYGGAPITGKASGGALLSLRDPSSPWPLDLQLANGPTHVEMGGTLQDPLHLKGANIKLAIAGPDMSLLEPLSGVPIPPTPPYKVTSNVDFAPGRIQFKNFQGVVGKSDVQGDSDFDISGKRPVLTANLISRRVDLTDFAGVIGAKPGGGSGAQGSAGAGAQKSAAAQRVVPDKPISVPRLTWADIHIKYHGQHIQGRFMPLDDVTAVVDLEDGVIRAHPVSFGVGQGRIVANATLTPQNDRQLRATADVDLRQVDVSRLMAATHAFQGAGTISGTATIDTVGSSVASMLANGNGGVRMGMVGGDLSSLLVDLSGLQFGNALLSALGIPSRTQVQCLVNDMPLQKGVLTVRALVVDTEDSIVNGSGTINLRNESLDLSLKTDPKHFSIGSLPAPINVSGTFGSPTIRPGAELAIRGGAAAGLAAVFPPLAILPTIQFGVGDDRRCDHLLSQARTEANGDKLPPAKRAPPR